ncbi:MAG: class I SAM-dependent methyltransferase [Patescibacteria group bacterium]
MFILYILVIVILLTLALTLFSGYRNGAPYVPSSMASVKHMLELADVKPDEVVLDMGSGDGRVLIEAVKDFNARGLGIEITPLLYIYSKFKVASKGMSDKIELRRENMYNSDISKADVVTMFLMQDTNQKLKEKLQNELKPGTRIVSHYFTFDDWQPVKTDEKYHNNLYIVPDNNS